MFLELAWSREQGAGSVEQGAWSTATLVATGKKLLNYVSL